MQMNTINLKDGNGRSRPRFPPLSRGEEDIPAMVEIINRSNAADGEEWHPYGRRVHDNQLPPSDEL